ncbi:hypothetical protein BH11MYX4_BH11MYX4_06440 [soil metagenome]
MAEIPDTNLVIFAYREKDKPSTAGVYSIPLKDYTDPKYLLAEGEGALPKYLLSQGVVAANMRNEEAGTGGFCYLLNIPALQPPKVDAIGLKLKPKDVISAIGALSKRTKLSDAAKKELGDALDKMHAGLPDV